MAKKRTSPFVILKTDNLRSSLLQILYDYQENDQNRFRSYYAFSWSSVCL